MVYDGYQALHIDVSGGIATVTIDNPPINLFDQSLYALLKAGEITEEDALLAADSANDLRLRMRGFSVDSA